MFFPLDHASPAGVKGGAARGYDQMGGNLDSLAAFIDYNSLLNSSGASFDVKSYNATTLQALIAKTSFDILS